MAAIAGRLGELWVEFNTDITSDPATFAPPTASLTPASFPAASLPATAYVTVALVDQTMNGNVDELETQAQEGLFLHMPNPIAVAQPQPLQERADVPA